MRSLPILLSALVSLSALASDETIMATTDIHCMSKDWQQSVEVHFDLTAKGERANLEVKLNKETAKAPRYFTIKHEEIALGRQIWFTTSHEQKWALAIMDREDTDYSRVKSSKLTRYPPRDADVEPTVWEMNCGAATVWHN